MLELNSSLPHQHVLIKTNKMLHHYLAKLPEIMKKEATDLRTVKQLFLFHTVSLNNAFFLLSYSWEHTENTRLKSVMSDCTFSCRRFHHKGSLYDRAKFRSLDNIASDKNVLSGLCKAYLPHLFPRTNVPRQSEGAKICKICHTVNRPKCCSESPTEKLLWQHKGNHLKGSRKLNLFPFLFENITDYKQVDAPYSPPLPSSLSWWCSSCKMLGSSASTLQSPWTTNLCKRCEKFPHSRAAKHSHSSLFTSHDTEVVEECACLVDLSPLCRCSKMQVDPNAPVHEMQEHLKSLRRADTSWWLVFRIINGKNKKETNVAGEGVVT